MKKRRAKKLVVVEPVPLSTKKSSVDWSKCCICQDKNKDNLVCPGRNKDSSKTLSGYNTLADNLCAFKQIGELGSIKHFDELDEGLGIAATLSNHEAKWHKSCRLQYNDTKLKRAQKKFEARGQTTESSRLTRSSVPPMVASVETVCFLCTLPEKRNNKLHLVTTLQLSERVKEWAKYVMDARLIGMLQTSDLVASEARYHHKCLQNLRNRCRKDTSSASSESSVCEAIAFAELVAYMQEKMESENYDFVFPMSTLTKMYKERLAQLLSIPEYELPDVRSTTLRESILDEFPQLLVHRPSKEYHLVCKSIDLSANAHSDDLSQDAIAFARFATALRKEMFKWKTCFKGTFDQDCQKSSVPPLLLTSVNMIVYGKWSPEECKATEPALTIAQLVMFNYKNRAPKGDVVRHNREQEPPLPLYTALDAYGRTRSRTVIDDLHKRGLSVSSKRVSEVTSALCHLNIDRAEEEKILCPSNLLQGVFTIGAYDNIDHNPSSNTSVGSFHGTSISVFQTPSIAQPGAHRSFQSSYNDSGPQTLDVPHLPESFATVPNVFLAQTKPKIPDSNVPSLSQMLPSETMRYETESEWLDHVLHCSSHEDGGNWSWAAYHANRITQNTQDLYCAVCSLLPLFFEESTSVSMVRHGMNIIKNITHHLNPTQTPVMYGDQPLYTIGKLIQWNWPDLYGEDKFVMMFAPFHIEKAFLGVIGQYMDGCGWISVAVNAGLVTQGSAEAILKVSHVKKSRTAHEITAAALYMLVDQAHTANSPDVSFETWVNEQATKIPMFRYWLTLLNLETLLLSFVRSLREGKYNLFRECLKQMLPWFFLFDHPNYARWLSVHVADLELLPTSAPDVHAEFCNGNFALRKTQKPFSALAVDQAHEQHNAIVKGDGGAIGLTQDPTALRRWMLAGPEICRLLEEFTNANKSSQELHHEQYPAFQKTFLRQVHAVQASFQEFGNPFQEQTTDLIAIDTRTIVDNDAVCTLTALEKNGKDLYRTFVEERLIKKTSTIFEPIKKVKTRIFATLKKPKNSKQLESVKALKCDVSLFSKLLISSQNRHLDLDVFFSYENQTCPPSLSSMGSMRACQKSDIVMVLQKKIEKNTPPESCNRNIFDGAALVHSHPPRSSKTLGQYCRKEFRQSIMQNTENMEARRVDIVWDLYSDMSLKKQVRDNRGQGVRRQVHENHKLPGNWSEFLKNAQNKEELFKLIGCYTLQEIIGVHIVTNIGPTIKSSKPTETLIGGLSVNSEEADGRIILHAKDMVINGATRIIIHTVDSDVVIIAISYFFGLKQLGLHELWISFGTGKHHSYIPAHELAQALGEDKAEAMRGYHAFTGCDTVSAFYSKGKTLTWKAWQQCLEATSAFRALSNPLKEVTDDLMTRIEKYVIMLYCGDTEIHSVNEARKILFTKNKSLQNIPPTRDALRMHTLRAAYQAGFVWGQALDPSGVIPSPADWGWTQTEGEWQPLWTTQPSIWEAARELVKCGCKNSCRGRCSCRREGMPCTLLCKSCYGNCDNTRYIYVVK
jgi:hypothetical protein